MRREADLGVYIYDDGYSDYYSFDCIGLDVDVLGEYIPSSYDNPAEYPDVKIHSFMMNTEDLPEEFRNIMEIGKQYKFSGTFYVDDYDIEATIIGTYKRDSNRKNIIIIESGDIIWR